MLIIVAVRLCYLWRPRDNLVAAMLEVHVDAIDESLKSYPFQSMLSSWVDSVGESADIAGSRCQDLAVPLSRAASVSQEGVGRVSS